MCFHREQVLDLFKKYPRVGQLLQEHLHPCNEYLGPDPPTGLEATAFDIASIAGGVFDYGPEDFGVESFLNVLEYLTTPIEEGTWLDRTILNEITNELEGELRGGPQRKKEKQSMRTYTDPKQLAEAIEAVLPKSLEGEELSVLFAIDHSGSMQALGGDPDIFSGGIEEIFKCIDPKDRYIKCCFTFDAESSYRYSPEYFRTLSLKDVWNRGRGTALQKAFNEVNKKFAALVLFTDGIGETPPPIPGVKMVWVLMGDKPHRGGGMCGTIFRFNPAKVEKAEPLNIQYGELIEGLRKLDDPVITKALNGNWLPPYLHIATNLWKVQRREDRVAIVEGVIAEELGKAETPKERIELIAPVFKTTAELFLEERNGNIVRAVCKELQQAIQTAQQKAAELGYEIYIRGYPGKEEVAFRKLSKEEKDHRSEVNLEPVGGWKAPKSGDPQKR